ncbi:MAG TPA: phospholipid carrier-dependent glycosyltransferase, partial [Spirochaetota bacterium]|nr:phospholipid carrier-dependent glycosyltransferase [Spirochaetota bacterium]
MLKKMISFIPFYALIFIAGMIIYNHNNDFPYFYHTTEPSKIQQITDHNYNFNHPLLMLNSASVAAFVSGADTDQEKVVAGRTVSAVYAALTVVVLALCVHLFAGFAASMLSGVFLLLSPKMIGLSHYFKEDPTFLFGIALSFLAFIMLFRRKTYLTLIAAAAASAIAASGKYVGLIFLPVGIFICATIDVANSSAESVTVRKRIVTFVTVFLTMFVIMNIQVFFSIPQIIERLFPLVSKTAAKSGAGIVAFTGHGGAQVARPLAKYCETFFSQTTILIPVLALGYAVFFFARFKSRTGAEKLLMAFFFFFTIMLSYGKVASGNYFLPQEMITHIFAALAIVNLVSFLSEFHGKRAAAMLGLIIAAVTVSSAYPFARDSMKQHSPDGDTRKKLVEWIENNSGRKMSIVCDGYVLLPDMIKRSDKLSSRTDLSATQ